jgi:hypothetical protein
VTLDGCAAQLRYAATRCAAIWLCVVRLCSIVVQFERRCAAVRRYCVAARRFCVASLCGYAVSLCGFAVLMFRVAVWLR